MSKDKSTRQGTSHLLRKNAKFSLVAFDEFGNREDYDYFIFSELTGTRVDTLLRVPEDHAIAYWEAHYAHN